MTTDARHVIDRVKYTRNRDGWQSERAPITCECRWSGTVAEWNAHRGVAAPGRGGGSPANLKHSPAR